MTPLVSISHVELDRTKITLKLIAGTSPKFNIVTTDYKYGKMHAELKHLVIDSQMLVESILLTIGQVHCCHHLWGFFVCLLVCLGWTLFLKRILSSTLIYFSVFWVVLSHFEKSLAPGHV